MGLADPPAVIKPADGQRQRWLWHRQQDSEDEQPDHDREGLGCAPGAGCSTVVLPWLIFAVLNKYFSVGGIGDSLAGR
jgi:hypothetical protein